jgi:hypothetical protein
LLAFEALEKSGVSRDLPLRPGTVVCFQLVEHGRLAR